MLMIGSSKNNRENYPRKTFGTLEKETRVKFNPGLSANRPSNNWALVVLGKAVNGLSYFLSYQVVLPALEHTSGDVRDPASRLILELYRKVKTVLNVLLQFIPKLTQMM